MMPRRASGPTSALSRSSRPIGWIALRVLHRAGTSRRASRHSSSNDLGLLVVEPEAGEVGQRPVLVAGRGQRRRGTARVALGGRAGVGELERPVDERAAGGVDRRQLGQLLDAGEAERQRARRELLDPAGRQAGRHLEHGAHRTTGVSPRRGTVRRRPSPRRRAMMPAIAAGVGERAEVVERSSSDEAAARQLARRRPRRSPTAALLDAPGDDDDRHVDVAEQVPRAVQAALLERARPRARARTSGGRGRRRAEPVADVGVEGVGIERVQRRLRRVVGDRRLERVEHRPRRRAPATERVVDGRRSVADARGGRSARTARAAGTARAGGRRPSAAPAPPIEWPKPTSRRRAPGSAATASAAATASSP